MIKEFAFGLANRHQFGDVHDIEKWAGMAQDTFMSLWDYDNHVIDYVKKKGTLASYDGMLYMPDEFILDVDGSNPDNELTEGERCLKKRSREFLGGISES